MMDSVVTRKKPVMKVWCLPALPEEALNKLHRDLVAAAVSVEDLHLADEKDLFVLFPADLMRYGLGCEILIEYADVEERWQRNHGELNELSSKLGNAVKRHFPTAFVQCVVAQGDDYQNFWTSDKSVRREDIAHIQAEAAKLLLILKKQTAEKCYCEQNVLDLKGPCGHCNEVAAYRYVVEEGARILALTEADEFQALADVYAADCRSGIYYELHDKLGWEK